MRYAHLEKDQLQQVKDLETILGMPILALEPIREIAKLKPDQLEQLKELEDELDLVLLAVQLHQLS